MDGSWTFLARLWRRVYHGRNSLARTSDRIEAAVLVGSVLTALAALPFAGAAGSSYYGGRMDVSVEQNSTRHAASATLLADGPSGSSDGHGAFTTVSAPTSATWTLPDGTPRIGKVDADEGTRTGETVQIWLDPAGNPVPAPLDPITVGVAAVAVGLGLWLALDVVLLIAYRIVRFALDRRRLAAWQLEWTEVRKRWTRS